MKKILMLILALLAMQSVCAIRISPDSIRINFEQNFEASYIFSTDIAPNTAVYIEGKLAEYLTVEKNNINKDGTFVIKVKLPAEIETPGDNVMYVGVTEAGKGGGMVSGRASIRTPIVVRVPYPGIYAVISFDVRNLNTNETTNFAVTINNLGKKNISKAKAAIDIITNENLVETLFTEEKPVSVRTTERLKAFFNASKHTPGPYKAIAHVTYDDKSKDLEKNFKIGTLNVEIINHTRAFFKDEIAKFDIEIKSGWNNKLDNVYAEVKVFNNTKEVSSFKTVSVNLKPWEKKIISNFWDSKGLGKGTYDVEITLFYEGSTTKLNGKIDIIVLKEEASFFKKYFTTTNLLVIVVILLIIINIIILAKKRQKPLN